MKILVATNNPAKIAELSAFLMAENYEIETLANLGLADIEETGTTFEENALLKAKYYARKSDLLSIADDSGLEIDALGGAPGVKSKRWIGEQASWLDLARVVVERLANTPAEARTARLRTVMAIATPDGSYRTAEATIEGRIIETLNEEKIIAGYPYRALLLVNNFGKLYADLTENEHEQVNQRKQAFQKLLPYLRGITA
ncbi:non-canonical purine NTP pyrophosphatase [Patescibacteria group bacterium]|nr:non-canonical purine NTP pyrophosphatase [Patescibacteria group bacterium]MBU1029234.1 non-canonical purine NTP pyrophosphatase [Patescibacteria group bacterium]MBU1916252.1 non-canonical purine NTP pyrophosphatase [Patescibacteria group bacterium]